MEDNPKYTILLVEDEETSVDLLVETLEDIYDVTVVMDGETALATVEDEKPDLILLDIMLPGMDGYEVCRILKEREEIKDIPVIFVTAKTDVEDETMGFAAGGVDYITKPVSPPVVRARVATHLKLRKSHLELERQNLALREYAQLREEVDSITRHDLKNPLQTIMAVLDLMQLKQDLSVSQNSDVERIRDASLRMLAMINTSLDLFKMERGIYSLTTQKLDISQLLQRVITEALRTNQAPREQIQILYECDGSPNGTAFFVQGEELLLYSMLSNLINNALEASPTDEDIVIGLKKTDNLFISINNKGEVPVEIRDKFFEKYTTCGKSGGTGLGTYSAKLIAQAHGGEIDLDSSQPGETTVRVRLRTSN